jgi:O-acetyl-ADP-ribose deacetylase (regulator of RNase III)
VIRIVQGELADTEAEAVLRPVSADWAAPTPAMRRLEILTGDAPTQQCMALGELPIGSAVITSAGDLNAQFMIHVVVRSYFEQVSEDSVRRGLENGLRRAEEWGIRRIAMPPLGTGAGNLDPDDAAAIMIPQLRDHVRSGGSVGEVEIYVDSDYERDVFERHLTASGAQSPD